MQTQTTDNVYANFLIRDEVWRLVDPNIEPVDVHELQMHVSLIYLQGPGIHTCAAGETRWSYIKFASYEG